ncbi:class A beta-lactamase [Sphingomonas endophytica]|uniref:beta-lactamase n=1 Tax=Sphingomonas endophytica TaxID=869719 RepID=A0ABR6N4M0_9SPHN|nr:class A beta-lactamase [Sphingomonas endophytica]MBB5725185.1 beta-lactamase class A [Sphingomonas endophytica]
MSSPIHRRHLLVGGAVALIGAAPGQEPVTEALRTLERRSGGRLGVGIVDTARGTSAGWRQHERFTQASSFKLSLAAMILAEAERGRLALTDVLRWPRDDLLPHSPVTAAAIAGSLPIRDLARAAVVTSDNTAANVLLRRIGGPARLTAFWRSTGDRISRLDRYEPALNVTPPGTSLDTTTPAAMAATVGRLLRGKVLQPASRTVLGDWMIAADTGRQRLRAGFPNDWRAGDKTGTGGAAGHPIFVDLAFGAPPGRAPLIVTAYFESPAAMASAEAEAVLAAVGRIAAGSAK